MTGEPDGRSDGWVVIARSDEVTPGPVARAAGGRHLVVWRTSANRVVVLDDSCPHQGTELSSGTVVGSTLRCRKHGWTIESDGWCDQAASGARSYPAREIDGRIEACVGQVAR